MNAHDKYRLRHNRVALVENIKPIDPVLEFLISTETLTPDMAEDINAETTNEDRVARLLNLLEKRGPIAFYHFRESINQQDAYKHLVLKLDNTDITKMPTSKPNKDETDARAFKSTGKTEPKREANPSTYSSASANVNPLPQSARIHNPRTAPTGGATGTAHTNQQGSQSSVVIEGNHNFVIMGGKNSKINFN